MASAGLTSAYDLHTCSFCSLIEAGRLQEVRKLLHAHHDPCRCWAKRQVYRVVRFYQRFLRDSRGDSMAKADVWKSPLVYRSPTRALVLEVCAKLVANGAAVNYTTGVETPLMAALSTCDEELLWLLLELKADVNLCDGAEDMNALGLAILLNHGPLVELLLKHGAKVNALCCGNLVPIQLAMNKTAAVSNLLMQYGADVHQLRTVSLDDRVFTSQFPLHVAILRKNVHLGRLLLEHGEDVNQTFNDTLESPIHQAVRNLDLDMIDLLIEYGADLNRPNAERHTPVGLALVMEDPVATEIAKRLILAGASANQKTRISYFQKTYSPLHIACFKGNLDFVRFLIEEVCERIGFWDEDLDDIDSRKAEEKDGGWAGAEKYPTKGSQGRYFRLLRRNDRFWGSTPSSSHSVGVRQGAVSSSSAASTFSSSSPTPAFQADAEDYCVRSELSPSPRAPVGEVVGEGGSSVVLAESVSPQPRNVPVAKSSATSTTPVETAETGSDEGSSICSMCRDSKDNPSGGSAAATLPPLPDPTDSAGSTATTLPAIPDPTDSAGSTATTLPAIPDPTDSASSTAASLAPSSDSAPEDEEAHSIVFVVGGELMERPTVKDQWMDPDDARCNCCEFCLSPEVVSSSVFVVNRGTQTVICEEDTISQDDSAVHGSTDADPASRSSQNSARSHESSETSPDITLSPLLLHRATQTHRPPPQHVDHQTTTQGATESATVESNPADPPPIFQAEFGSPDYDFPPEMEKWQKRGERGRVKKSHSVARFLNQVGNDGSTALFMAVYDGNVELVDYLLHNGADPYFSSQHGNFFHAAVLNQSVALLQRALELRCDINEVNMFGNSPLTLISRLDLPEACELLVSHGADMNSRDRYGETPLLASVYFGCEMNARTLIQHGAALDLVDDNHTSAIYWSIFNNRQRTLKLLLMAGATFTPQVFRQYPRNIRVMNNRPLFHFIHHYVHQPRSLQDLATISVRTYMAGVKQGRSILADVNALPVPNRLKDILRLKHFIDVIEAEAKADDILED